MSNAFNNAKKLAKTVSVTDFGAVGDGVTDDTAAISSFLAAGGGVIPNGTYICGAVTASVPFVLEWKSGGVIKQKDGTGSANWITLTAGAAGSDFGVCNFDGNKAGQTFVSNVSAIRLNTVDGIRIRGVISNAIASPLLTTDSDELDIDIRVEDCNTSVNMARGDDCDVFILAKRTNNNGLALFQHAVDFSDFTDSRLGARVQEQGGDSSGLSTFASGITLIRNEGCHYTELTCVDHLADSILTLGVSFVGGRNCTGSKIIVEGFRQAVEFAGLQDSVFDSIVIDGKYRKTTAVPLNASLTGIISHAGAQYYPSGVSGSVSATRGVQISTCRIARCGTGVRDRCGGLQFCNLSSVGNTVDGYRSETISTATEYFPGSAEAPIDKISLGVVNLSGNGRAGVMLDEARSGLSIVCGRITNNGQDSSYASIYRAGISMQTAGAKDGVIVSGCDICDTQDYTKNLAISYNPGTTDSNNQYTFSLLSPGFIGLGEYVTLIGALTGPSDVTGKVVDVDKDELTIEFSGAQAFIESLSSSTGTISSSGTTVTGVGTAFSTEIIGRCWIKAGGEWRQVMKVASDTSLTVSSAFASALSGSTFSRQRVSISGVPSQQYGVYYDDNTTDADFGQNNFGLTNFSNVVTAMHGESNLNSVPYVFRGGAEATLYRTGDYLASLSTDVYVSVPAGYEMVGYRWQNITDVVGTTGSTITLALFGGASTTLASGLDVTQNTKSAGNIAPQVLTADTTIRATFGGGADNVPSAGSYRCEVRVRRSSFPAFPSV